MQSVELMFYFSPTTWLCYFESNVTLSSYFCRNPCLQSHPQCIEVTCKCSIPKLNLPHPKSRPQPDSAEVKLDSTGPAHLTSLNYSTSGTSKVLVILKYTESIVHEPKPEQALQDVIECRSLYVAVRNPLWHGES